MGVRVIELFSRLRALCRRHRLEDDFRDEVAAHVERLEGDYRRLGMTPAEAHRAARIQFGGMSQTRDAQRDHWGFPRLDAIAQDLRFATRLAAATPGAAIALVLTLALGIGVPTALFGVVRAVLLAPLPYPHADRLVNIGEDAGNASGISVTWDNFVRWRNDNRTFDDMAGYQFAELTWTGGAEPMRTRARLVTHSYFGLTGITPVLGRVFGPGDDYPEAPSVAVLSHRFWIERFGGRSDVIGRQMTLGARSVDIIGVAAPAWHAAPVDYYLPLGRVLGRSLNRGAHGSMRVLARLQVGKGLDDGRADLNGIMRRSASADSGSETSHRANVRALTETLTAEARRPLFVLMAASALVLFIACANAASLWLARNMSRMGELTTRSALGAGRERVARQLLTESLALAGLGGAGGLGIAILAVRVLTRIAPTTIPRIEETAVDPAVLVFALAVTCLVAVLVALAPVLSVSRLDLVTILSDGGGRSHSSRRQFARNALVIGEVALTCVLVFGAGLLLRSLHAAANADMGFDVERTLTFALSLPETKYPTPDARRFFYERLVTQLRTVPGVSGAAAVSCAPGDGDCGDWFYSIVGAAPPRRDAVPVALFKTADESYFATMTTMVRDGRAFSRDDQPSGPLVAIVNETFARQWWPFGSRQSAVGRQIKVGGPYAEGPIVEIVGVVADTKQQGADSETQPEIYQPVAQHPISGMSLVVRAAGAPSGLAGAIRAQVAALDPDLPVLRLETFAAKFDKWLSGRRFSTTLLALFAGFAVLLAIVGIHSLLAYWVVARERDLAIRLAIGARPITVLLTATSYIARLVVSGIVLALPCLWLVARGLDGLVFGVSSTSPSSVAVAVAVIALVAIIGAVVPTLRAARIDPGRRLRLS